MALLLLLFALGMCVTPSSHAYCNVDCVNMDQVCLPDMDNKIFCCSESEGEDSSITDCSGWCSAQVKAAVKPNDVTTSDYLIQSAPCSSTNAQCLVDWSLLVAGTDNSTTLTINEFGMVANEYCAMRIHPNGDWARGIRIEVVEASGVDYLPIFHKWEPSKEIDRYTIHGGLTRDGVGAKAKYGGTDYDEHIIMIKATTGDPKFTVKYTSVWMTGMHPAGFYSLIILASLLLCLLVLLFLLFLLVCGIG